MSRGFLASGLSTYDFSTLNTTLPHNLIKEKLTYLIEQIFKREGSLYFNFETVKFPFLDGNVPHSPSYGVYISQLIRFARVCSNVDDFNNRNLFLVIRTRL